MPRFEHIALTSPDQEIRLLTIEAADEADDIRCSLSVAKLNDFPEYTAISYEWGEPEPLIDIAINRSRFSVRHNLFLLLQRVRAQRMRRTTQQYWIDAICIDQDDAWEKASQVQMMGRIYRQARLVISWLGWPSRWHAGQTFKFIEDINRSSELAANHSALFDYTPLDAISRHFSQWLMIKYFCGCSYWSRRWIVQEVMLPNHVLICCGTEQIAWAPLEKLFSLVGQTKTATEHIIALENLRLEQPSIYRSVGTLLCDITDSIPFQIWRHREALRRNGGLAAPLPELLVAYRSTACQLVHDRVYALADISSGQTLTVDYYQSPAEVLAAVVSSTSSQDITYSNLQAVVQTLELPWSVERGMEIGRSIVIDDNTGNAESASLRIETLALKFQARVHTMVVSARPCGPLIQALLRDQIRNPNDFGTLGQGVVEAAHFSYSRRTMDRPHFSTAHIQMQEHKREVEDLFWLWNKHEASSDLSPTWSKPPTLMVCADGTWAIGYTDAAVGDLVCQVDSEDYLLLSPYKSDLHGASAWTATWNEHLKVTGTIEPLKWTQDSALVARFQSAPQTAESYTSAMPASHMSWVPDAAITETSRVWEIWRDRGFDSRAMKVFQTPIEVELCVDLRELVHMLEPASEKHRIKVPLCAPEYPEGRY